LYQGTSNASKNCSFFSSQPGTCWTKAKESHKRTIKKIKDKHLTGIEAIVENFASVKRFNKRSMTRASGRQQKYQKS
jgi:hypothetical protein